MFQINNRLLNNRSLRKKKNETPPPQFKYSQSKVTMERTFIPKFKLQKGGDLVYRYGRKRKDLCNIEQA